MSGGARVLLGVLGAILLLPGVCSAGFMIAAIPDIATGRNLAALWLFAAVWIVGFVIAFAGVALLRKAFRGGPT